MYDVSIAILIPIIKLTIVYYEERERKKQVWLYSIILWNCKYVTICSVFVLYEINIENPPPPPHTHTQKKKKKKKKNFFVKLGILVWNWEKNIILFDIGNGPNFGPNIRWSRALNSDFLSVTLTTYHCPIEYSLILFWKHCRSRSAGFSEASWSGNTMFSTLL